uniref:Inter-alpha-trypsin inhibitor heavy chain H4 n=1 Tax=Timema monikensis TaxID=170555 RepID=A0A7R9E6N5_9NEOP|nr:unnamed protein product [Timema monikensis]
MMRVSTMVAIVVAAAFFLCGVVQAQDNALVASLEPTVDGNDEGGLARRKKSAVSCELLVSTKEAMGLLEIDGKVYTSHVKEKQEAKKEYDAAVSSGQTAAHVVQSTRNSNRFTVSVNIEREKKVTFNLTYEELLRRELSVYNHAININPGQIVPDLSVEVYINESSKITTLEVPALKGSNEINQENATQDNPLAKIERPSDTSAIIRWSPTPEEQKQLNSEGVKGQLVVRYDVDRESHPQQILVNEGYFVHFFAPSNLPTLKKHVTFVLDVSGSMSGRKSEQLRVAMTTILSDLKPGDFFSVIIFSSDAQVWDPEHSHLPSNDYSFNTPINKTKSELLSASVVPATKNNIDKAKEFIGHLDTYSSRLISMNDDLTERPEPIVIFLTDGQPNEEESDPIVITDTITASNKNASAAIFCLAFGDDVDLDFLKKLSLRNSGFARKIYEASDAAIQLQDFYRQVASPLLADVSFNYTENQVEEGSVSKTHFNTLFLGSEFVVTGKLKSTELTGGLTARSPNGTTSLPFGPDIILICPRFPPTGEPTEEHNVTNASFMERLWAYLTIQQLLEKDKVDSPPEVNTTSPNKKRALELALKYSFVTPLTSLVVVKPNETTSADTEKVVKPNETSADTEITTSADTEKGFSSPLQQSQIAHSFAYDSIHEESLFYRDLLIVSDNYTLSPVSGLTIVPLRSLAWLNNVTSEAGITLPTNPEGADEVLQLGLNQTNSAFSECTTSLGGSGHCRHLPYCALDIFTLNVTDYLPFFCRIQTLTLACFNVALSYNLQHGGIKVRLVCFLLGQTDCRLRLPILLLAQPCHIHSLTETTRTRHLEKLYEPSEDKSYSLDSRQDDPDDTFGETVRAE